MKIEISLIVSLQIALIIVSFLSLVYIESEWLLISDSIDVAGLNRFFSSMVILEVRSYTYDNSDKQNFESIEKLQENIALLKKGGEKNGVELRELPAELDEGWQKINQTFTKMEEKSNELLTFNDPIQISNIQREIEGIGLELIQHSDLLVKDLSAFSEKKDRALIDLQLILLFTNVIAHVILVFIIFRILDNEANDRVRREKLITIGKIGAGLSHDLRTPLSILRLSFELLKTDHKQDQSSREKLYQKIDKSIDKLEYQTADVLEFVQTRGLKKENANLKEILDRSLADLVIPKGIKIKEFSDGILVNVDKIKMQTVFSNIIQNAIQALGNQGIIIIKAEKKPNKVTISFEDNGPGIPEDILPLIFEPLYTTKDTGTGLGLANCRRIVEEHGGKISVTNNPTKFSIELPVD